MSNYDHYIEKSHHPENFSPPCRVCGGLTFYGECYRCDHEACDECGENLAACVCNYQKGAK